MARSYTGRVVLDTSVVAKMLLAPPRYLQADIYEKETKGSSSFNFPQLSLGIFLESLSAIFFSSSNSL